MPPRNYLAELLPSGTNFVSSTFLSADGIAALTVSAGSVPGTIQSSTTWKHSGDTSVRFQGGGSATQQVRLPFIAANNRGASRWYHWATTFPPAGIVIANLRHSGGQLARIGISAAGAIFLQSGTGATLGTSADGAWAPNRALGTRFELVFDNSAGAGQGVATLRAFNGDSTTPSGTVSVSAVDLGTAAATSIDIGTPQLASSTWVHHFDDIGLDNGSTTEMGPYVVANNPPTATISSPQTVAPGASVTVTAAGSDTDGSIASYAWSVVSTNAPSAPTPPPSGPSAGSWTFAASSATTGVVYRLKCTVTDNGGATVEVFTQVYVPTSASPARHVAVDGTGIGAWTKPGGAATDGAALNDESDATYLQSPTLTGVETSKRVPIVPLHGRSGYVFTERLSLSEAGAATARFRVYQGNALLQDFPVTGLTVSPADFTFTLSNPAAVTNPNELHGELAGTS